MQVARVIRIEQWQVELARLFDGEREVRIAGFACLANFFKQPIQRLAAPRAAARWMIVSRVIAFLHPTADDLIHLYAVYPQLLAAQRRARQDFMRQRRACADRGDLADTFVRLSADDGIAFRIADR